MLLIIEQRPHAPTVKGMQETHRFETPGGALMPNILHAPELLAARESAIYQKYVSVL